MLAAHPFNRDVVTELIEENVALRVLLSYASGAWLSSENDDEKQDALVIPADKVESMEGK